MIGLDTNVLVRYLAQDDPKQSALATRLIEKQLSVARPGFVSLVVLAETCWVLGRLYAATQEELASTIEDLLTTAQFHIERREVVQEAVQHFNEAKRSTAGFVDVLISKLASSEGCSQIVTFDKAAVRGAGMTLLA
ncbi:PIN domain-containing protein [Caenimonas koreensis DSM 17982]|uniref:PIN domain-containing protein n=1 Tax=Caenimonas koreensis DSM 17982 TaxID=1121255 RepID=A0A844B5V3_9BURK|nr:type II toxin-antitoxin system VapC family toxin [Caenimonas koreensis]MRD46877.1 PIN domain-containing protein [Caenimonas koreensis DSM 17982]